jgi:ribose 5-phosphate isomerase B
MNLICLGGRISGFVSAEELVLVFLNAEFFGEERHLRRLRKIQKLEKNWGE